MAAEPEVNTEDSGNFKRPKKDEDEAEEEEDEIDESKLTDFSVGPETTEEGDDEVVEIKEDDTTGQ